MFVALRPPRSAGCPLPVALCPLPDAAGDRPARPAFHAGRPVVYLETASAAHHEDAHAPPASPGPSRSRGAGLLHAAARGKRPARGARRGRGRVPRADRVGLADPGRRGMAHAVGLRGAGAAGGRGGGPPARLLLGRDRAELPPAAVPAGRGDPVRRRRPGVRRDRAAGAGPLLAALRGEARGGPGPSWAGRRRARSTASSTCRSARRPGARGTCRSASRTSSCGWRRARSSRPPRRSARPPSPSSVAAGSGSPRRLPPSASSCASSEVPRAWTARSAGPSSASTPPTSTACSRRASSCPRRPRARAGRTRSASSGNGRSAASRSTPPSLGPPGGSCRAWATRWWTSRGGGSGC